ncbi:MAG TPA: LytTR family DNA-binding domain-containing protein [Gemmatimonadaceae bacterium]|nr:LytTR family DNA-binding domain-containing protein [Gemmatimonadaceae bacterium]
MRILIVDDEAPARRRVRRLLEAQPGTQVVGEAASGDEAVSAIRTLRPDLVFLDVQMPGRDGFGVVEAVGVDAMPATVFVTAHDEHAVRAFEVQALDYLLKPFTPDRFRAVLARARARRAANVGAEHAGRLAELVEALGAAERPRWLQRVLVHDGPVARLLPVSEVTRVVAEKNYVRLHAGATSYQLRATLATMAERLDPALFLRINRSEIVRLDAIRELQPWFHGDYRVVLHDGTTTMWSRRFRARADLGAALLG